MFAKRRYNRKKGTRKPFRRRVRKRARILRPVRTDTSSDPVPPKPTFDASGSSVYLWQYVAPQMGTKPKQTLDRLPSLRQLCAVQVAHNCEGLSLEYLQEAPWTCWQPVWENILKLRKDSPDLFRMFALQFGMRPSFRCHASTFAPKSSAGLDMREQALELALIPAHRKHRIDNVFSNVSLADLGSFVAKLPCLVVATCSKLKAFSAPQLISVFSIANLSALDLSGNDLVDDQLIYTLRLCLVSKKLGLKILRVSGCSNLTKRGVASLFKDDPDLHLCYVETDIDMISGSTFAQKFLDEPQSVQPTPVLGTKWKLLSENDPATAEVSHYSLAYKVQYYLRNSDLIPPPSMIWDLKFFPEAMDLSDSKSASELYQESWSERLRSARMKSVFVPYCYLKDPNQKVVTQVEAKPKPMMEPSGPFTRQGATTTKRSVMRKPKIIAADANLFFGL